MGAIEANGAAVDLNKRAFNWGRMAAVDLAAVERTAGLTAPAPVSPQTEPLDALIARRAADLVDFQDAAYAARYKSLAKGARDAAARLGPEGEAFARAVAVNAYKVMAYKDEYEVARLYAHRDFQQALKAQFSGAGRTSVWLAPPLLSRLDPATGRPAKHRFGPWVFTIFRVLAAMKGLRGRWFDPVGHTPERRAERALAEDYLSAMCALCAELATVDLDRATALAALPDMVRGFGPVKAQALEAYAARRAALIAAPAREPRAKVA